MLFPRRSVVAGALTFGAAAWTGAGQVLAWTTDCPHDAGILALLEERIRALGATDRAVTIAVGLLRGGEWKVIAAGCTGHSKAGLPTLRTVFEIGSITKAFTGLLLAEMALAGMVSITDPARAYLHGRSIPYIRGREITLADLATHTSGLPFMPVLAEADQTTSSVPLREQFYRFLANYEPEDIGNRWEYSNLGYWLLGEVLAARSGLAFDVLMRRRILEPLRLERTEFRPTKLMLATLAPGHDAAFNRAPSLSENPAYALMPAAGGLHSTIEDLLRVIEVAMRLEPSPLAKSIASSLRTRRPAGQPGELQALGWTLLHDNGEVVFCEGGTFGYASAMAWDSARRLGTVVLSNQVTSVADIARHLVLSNFPLQHPVSRKRTKVELAQEVLDLFAGAYEAEEEGVFIISRKGSDLLFTAPSEWGLPAMTIHPESERSFFATELPLQVIFEGGQDLPAAEIQIHPPRGQHVVRARRMDNSN